MLRKKGENQRKKKKNQEGVKNQKKKNRTVTPIVNKNFIFH